MTEWYQSPTWSPEIAEAFEAKLARARVYNRANYLSRQGATLGNSKDPAMRGIGIQLLRRAIARYDEAGPSFYEISTHESLAKVLVLNGELDEAESEFRWTLARMRTTFASGSMTTGVTELLLAELLLDKGDDATLREADQLLTAVEQQIERMSFFRNVVLRFLVARARVHFSLGLSSAEQYAIEALAVADETEPSLKAHPTLGRPVASPMLRAELARIVAERREGAPELGWPFSPAAPAPVIDPAADPIAAARMTEMKDRRERNRLAWRPLCDDLRTVGVDIDDPYGLSRWKPYDAAIPFLIRFLQARSDDHTDTVRHPVASALAVEEARPWWADITRLYLGPNEQTAKDKLAGALSVLVSEETCGEFIDLAIDPANGSSRVVMIGALHRMSDPRGRAALDVLRRDPDVADEVKRILRSARSAS